MAAESFTIPELSVPLGAPPDQCGIGGGAGITAAVGAARCGVNVLLIEKCGLCGGTTRVNHRRLRRGGVVLEAPPGTVEFMRGVQ